jgi:hypothetical protein
MRKVGKEIGDDAGAFDADEMADELAAGATGEEEE